MRETATSGHVWGRDAPRAGPWGASVCARRFCISRCSATCPSERARFDAPATWDTLAPASGRNSRIQHPSPHGTACYPAMCPRLFHTVPDVFGLPSRLTIYAPVSSCRWPHASRKILASLPYTLFRATVFLFGVVKAEVVSGLFL